MRNGGSRGRTLYDVTCPPAARENLRLQGLVWLLAIVTGVLTLITAVEPAGKLYRLISDKASPSSDTPVPPSGSAGHG